MLLENNELNVDTKCFYEKNDRTFNRNSQEITALKLAEYNKKASIVELLKERSNQSEESGIDLSFKNQEFKGIINYLKTTSNINNELDMNASSKFDGNLTNLIQYDSNDDFYTCNVSRSWISFKFKNHKVIPTHYTIKTFSSDKGECHLRNWIVEGSNDGEKWCKIDEQNNCSVLNGSYCTHTFNIQHHNNQKFTYLRILQTLNNWRNDNYLRFNMIEFYGKLF